MKKYFVNFIFMIILLFAACDKRMDYDYFIINQCDEKINVYFEITSQTVSNNWPNDIVIQSKETKQIYYGRGINALENRLVEHFFTKITIQKGNQKSKLNYIDKSMWKFEPTSKTHANSYLTVNPEDFEDE